MTEAQEHIARISVWFRIEKDEELSRYKEILHSQSPTIRKKEGLAWFPIKIEETGFGLASFPFVVVSRNPGDNALHVFSRGTPISVIDEGGDAQIFGHVLSVTDRQLRIGLSGDDIPDWLEDAPLSVNKVFDTKSFEQGEKALQFILNAEKGRWMELREIIHGNRDASWGVIPNLLTDDLNVSQLNAVKNILTAQDVAVVFGPPGTGKTTTLVRAMYELSGRGNTILACAPSNAAVDNLALKLAEKGLQVVRIGAVSRIDEKIFERSLDFLVSHHPQNKEAQKLRREWSLIRKKAASFKRNFGPEQREKRKRLYRESRQLAKTIRDLEMYIIDDILSRAQVVCTTLVGASSFELKDKEFDVLFIDEAGQSSEPLTWVPILKANKLVLAGDPFQLPPTVKSRKVLSQGLSISLLEHLIKQPKFCSFLDVQYRMHEDIMAFSNIKFYQGKLKAHDSVASRSLDEKVFEFVDTAGCGFEEKSGDASLSKYNEGEIQIIQKHIAASGIQAPTAIVSPYREQVERLRSEGFPNWVEVNTVDSFQGQERDVVYISLVRSNDSGQIGFLSDYRRMNVAMTRAKCKLVIVGDSATVGMDAFFCDLLEFCEKNGFYRSAWDFMYS